jgi:hypothetical protein
VQQNPAESLKPNHGPIQENSDDRLRRGLASQVVQVSLYDGGGIRFGHARTPLGSAESARKVSTRTT